MVLNPLPNDKNLDMTKLKAFADDKLNIAETMISLFSSKENSGKRKKCLLPAFSPFPTVFSKVFFFRVVKSQDCVVKSLLYTTQSQLLTTPYRRPFETIVGKGENVGDQHFLLFPQCFLLFPNQISIFQLHSFCCLQMLSN